MRYEILIAGEVDDRAADMLAGLDVSFDAGTATISGDLDQAALHGLLERIRTLGLELLEVRRVRRRP